MAKIILLHYSAPPIVGGVESVIGHQSRLMAEDGHDVGVIAGRGEAFDTRVRFDRLPLADSRHPEILKVKSALDRGQVPDKFHGLVKDLKAALIPMIAGTDILIAHNVCSLNKNLPLTTALRQVSEGSDHPHLVQWHHDLAWTTPRYQSELHDGFPWNLLKQAWPGVTQVTVSASRRDELAALQKIDRNTISIIPNGIDVAEFLKLEDQTRSFIKELKLVSASPVILLPVRITPRKNIELALNTLAHIRNQFPDARLVVTGPLGPHNPANQAYFESLLTQRENLGLRDAVHFLTELTSDFIPDKVISDFYQLADALLFPSREEGFGLPVLEAALAGIPVFCSDIPPLKALGDRDAFYFSPDDKPEKVAGLIINYLQASPGFGLRSAVKKTYSWERIYMEKIAPLLKS